MNITKQEIDNLTFELHLSIEREDCNEKVDKALRAFRKTADIRGFRKGMAPMGIIKKIHGGSALVDAVNELIQEQLTGYVKDNKLSILGEPLPNEEKTKEIDWVNDNTFEFVFDVALAPEFDAKISADDKVVSYTIKVEDEEIEKRKENLLKQYGKLDATEAVSSEEDFIVADLVAGENKVEGTYVTLRNMSDESKALFIGKKAGDSFDVNVNEVFTNETDRAAMLHVKKEELANIAPVYNFTIKEVKTFVPAVENEEFYNKAFGQDAVKNADEAKAKIAEQLKSEYVIESDYRFTQDVKEYLIKRTDIKVPEQFMKKWLFAMNQGKVTMEDIDKEFDLFLKDFRWQIIREKIMKENNLELTDEKVLEAAKKIASYQFAMYGMNNVPEEQLTSYAQTLLNNEREGRRIYEKSEEDMVIAFIKEKITLEPKEISISEISKLNN